MISVLLLITIGIKNSIDYSSSLKRRTFIISEINSYLGKYNFQNRPVIGAWAPSLSWGSKAISFPVWKDYFNEVEFRLYKVGSKSHLIYAIDRKSKEYRISYIIS